MDNSGNKMNTTSSGQEVVTVAQKMESLTGLWKIFAIVVCLSMSGLICGLHIAIMSIDLVELRCMAIAGTEKEMARAKKILPIRQRPNYLLTAMTLACVCLDSATTLLVDSLFADCCPALSVIVSTILITTFAGIVPEAVVFRYSIAIAAKTIYITYFIMLLMFPIAYPVSKCLDYLLKHNKPIRDRKYLSAYIDEMTKRDMNLDEFEYSALKGTLTLNSKIVREIMTPMDKVLTLPENASLDWRSFLTILKTGFSRIPVHRDERSHIVGILLVKDIADELSENNNATVSIKSVLQKSAAQVTFVAADTALSSSSFVNALREDTHFTFVTEGNQVIGIVTLEDLIDEVVGQRQGSDPGEVTRKRSRGVLYAQQIVKALEEECPDPRNLPIPL